MAPVSRKDIPIVGSVKLEEAEWFVKDTLLRLEAYQRTFTRAVKGKEITGVTLDDSKAEFKKKGVNRYLKVLKIVMDLRDFIVEEGKWPKDIRKYMQMEATIVNVEEFRKRIHYMYLSQYTEEASLFLNAAIKDTKTFYDDIKGRIAMLKEERKQQLAAQARRRRLVA